MIPDRWQKAQAPDALKPTNRFGSPEGSLKHFVESRTATENFLKDTPDLRAHAWTVRLAGQNWTPTSGCRSFRHSQRHTKSLPAAGRESLFVLRHKKERFLASPACRRSCQAQAPTTGHCKAYFFGKFSRCAFSPAANCPSRKIPWIICCRSLNRSKRSCRAQ